MYIIGTAFRLQCIYVNFVGQGHVSKSRPGPKKKTFHFSLKAKVELEKQGALCAGKARSVKKQT